MKIAIRIRLPDHTETRDVVVDVELHSSLEDALEQAKRDWPEDLPKLVYDDHTVLVVYPSGEDCWPETDIWPKDETIVVTQRHYNKDYSDSTND